MWKNINKKPTLFERGKSCHFIIIYYGKHENNLNNHQHNILLKIGDIHTVADCYNSYKKLNRSGTVKWTKGTGESC